jgi:multicomponent Na+:H+ antiporter subunit C
MTASGPAIALVLTIVVLVAAGVYLLLERSLTRVLLGVIMIGNGINLLLLVAGGAAGGPPIVGHTDESAMSDPLPQAMVLTAIVITLGISAFLVTIAYRPWQLTRPDEVQDDQEDRRVARRAAADRAAFVDADAGESTLDQEAAEVHDETVHEEALAEDARRGAATRRDEVARASAASGAADAGATPPDSTPPGPADPGSTPPQGGGTRD